MSLETELSAEKVVSGEFLATRLGISYSMVCRLAKRGVVHRRGAGEFLLWASILSYSERNRERKAGRAPGDDEDESPDLVRERALLARAQREAQAMKNEALRAELLPVEDVEAVVGAVLDATRAKMQALPSKLAPRCLGLESLAQMRDVLTAGVTEAYDELSNTRVVAAAIDRARQDSGGDSDGDPLDEAAEAPSASDRLAVE